MIGEAGRLRRDVRAALVVLGAAAIVLGLLHPAFRVIADGAVSSGGWMLAVVGTGITLIAAAWGTSWGPAAAWFGLALAGQSAALNMVDSSSANVLEHYHGWDRLLAFPYPPLLLVTAVQLCASVLGVRSPGRRFSLIPPVLTRWRVVIALVLTIAVSAYARFDLMGYAAELALATIVLGANLLNLIVLAAAIPRSAIEAAGRGLDRAGDRVPLLCAAWCVLVSTLIALFVFDRTPVIPDAVAYLVQARYFAEGSVALPVPPELPAFAFDKFHADGTRWWSYGFPGWPAVLAAGVLLGVPWLINPLVAGVTVLLVHSLVRRLYDARRARGATLLLAASPWFLFMSASHMPHAVSLLWAVGSMTAVLAAWQTRRIAWAAVAGAALGAVFLARPLEALLLAPVLACMLFGFTGHGTGWRGTAAFTLGGALVTSLLFLYNHAVTGAPLRTPHSVYADARDYPGADRLGFGPEVGNLGWEHLDPLPGHGPADIIINAHMNATSINRDLFGWACGSLVLAFVFLLWGRPTRADWLMLLVIGAVALGHSFYWFSGGPDIGARYWYQTLIPLIVLALRGADTLESRRARSGASDTGRVAAFLAVACLTALLAFVPWRSLVKYHDYRGMNRDLAHLAETQDFGRSVVFIRENGPSDYANAFLLNPLGLEGPGPIYARDLGPQSRARVLSHFPGRPWWIVEGPTGASRPFLVLEGPVAR